MEELARRIEALNLQESAASNDRQQRDRMHFRTPNCYDSVDWSYDLEPVDWSYSPTALYAYQLSYRSDYVDVYRLMTDESGVPFCNLLRCGNYCQVSRIVDLVTRDKGVLFQVAKNRFGVFSIIMLMDVVATNLREQVMSVLDSIVFQIMTDAEACLLVSFSLDRLDYAKNSYLFEAASKHCRKLAKDETGGNVLSECIRFAREPDRRWILCRITRSSVDLAKHSNGNLLIQHILEKYDREVSVNMCLMFAEGHLEELSKNSHGSHVLEKCLRSCGRRLILNGLASFEKEKLKELAEDSFGNYVIQTALRTQPGFFRDQLYLKIREIAPELHVNKFTRKIAMLVG